VVKRRGKSNSEIVRNMIEIDGVEKIAEVIKQK
jgi:hypothetical protein